MALNRKYLGIRFPFTAQDPEGFFVDMEYDPYKEIKSDLMHLIFTPKGQRLRMPIFGTNLIRYIFEPNDDISYTDIKVELQESIKKFIPNVKITSLIVTNSTTENYTANIQIKYDIDEGSFITSDSITTSI